MDVEHPEGMLRISKTFLKEMNHESRRLFAVFNKQKELEGASYQKFQFGNKNYIVASMYKKPQDRDLVLYQDSPESKVFHCRVMSKRENGEIVLWSIADKDPLFLKEEDLSDFKIFKVLYVFKMPYDAPL